MIHRFSNRMVGIGLLAFCALAWFWLVPTFVGGEEAAFFPRLSIAWIALFSLLTAAFPPVVAPVPRAVARPDLTGTASEEERFPSVYGLMAIWAVYVVAIGQLGFYIATFAMLAISMYYLGIRRVVPLLLRPAITLGIIYLLLDVGLNFRLPEAFWQ